MKKFLNKLERFLIFLLPVVIFFSYYPVIKLGSTESMNLELSIPLIWLAIFGSISIPKAIEVLKSYRGKKAILILLFPFWVTLSILWSKNTLRGVLTTGIIWLIIFSIINLINQKLTKNDLKRLLKIFLTTSVLAAGFCIIQCILDVFEVGRSITLLCQGCTYQALGFPHPNGLAIEPQFMGNLLILPCLTSLLLLYNAIKSNKNNKQVFGFVCLSFFLIMSLYICFSRGAIYSFCIGAVIIGLYLLKRDKALKVLIIGLPIIIGFALGLLGQGLLAEKSATNENFTQGIQRSIHQISLGKIDIREVSSDDKEDEATSSSFDGYIQESTDIRLNLNEVAINYWKNNILVGSGIGGAGVAISKSNNELSSKEIIQNEYLSILVETGLIGIILLFSFGGVIIKSWKAKDNILIIAIIISYAVSLCFFSGLPNVLHIYLFTPVLYLMGCKSLI